MTKLELVNTQGKTPARSDVGIISQNTLVGFDPTQGSPINLTGEFWTELPLQANFKGIIKLQNI